MKVSELVAKLQALPNQDAEVLVNVRTPTKVFGVAQVTPWDVCQSHGGATIEITLPKGMAISVRKTQKK
jgi:hypothetical protein